MQKLKSRRKKYQLKIVKHGFTDKVKKNKMK